MRRRNAAGWSGRGGRAARPSALIDAERNQSRRRERPRRVGELRFCCTGARTAARSSHRPRRRCRTGNEFADRTLGRHARHCRTGAAVAAQFEARPTSHRSRQPRRRSPAGYIERKDEALQGERINEDAGETRRQPVCAILAIIRRRPFPVCGKSRRAPDLKQLLFADRHAHRPAQRQDDGVIATRFLSLASAAASFS